MKKLSFTKKVGFAASLLLASSMASANVYDLGTLTGTTDEDYNVASGSFTDTFNFSIDESSFFNVFASSTVDSISEFASIVLTTTGDTGTTGTLFNFVSFAELSNTSLSIGSYSLDITGTAVNGSSGYVLSTSVSPVPEPGTIALMLGGLGLVGFMAARRHKLNS